MEDYEYWKRNFVDESVVNISDNLQLNIARTKRGKPVDPKIWEKTVRYIIDQTELQKQDNILELCCGNGVLLGELSKYVKRSIGVDYSDVLLKQFEQNFKLNNLTLVNKDILEYVIERNSIDKIFIYFSIQHFDEYQTLNIIKNCLSGLKKNGIIFIGDIPDLDEKWKYISKPEYRKDYLNRVLEKRPKIGFWFHKEFFKSFENYFSNIRVEILNQPKYQINSDHCFDVKISKS